MTLPQHEKAQPWRSQWPPASHKAISHGTKHGFSKGETVVMDGNAVGLSMPKTEKPPVKGE